MNVARNLVNRVRGWLPKEPLPGQVKILQLTLKTKKPTKTRIALSFVVIFVVVLSTLSILQVLGLGFYAPFVAGAVAVLASAVLSVLVWKPHNQTAKSNEVSKGLER